MSTKTSKVRKAMSLSVADKVDWVNQYNSKKSFPSKEVPCTSCNEGITMFGTNLRNRVERFDTVEDFLEQFVCRTCKGKAKRGEEIVAKEVDTVTEEVVDHDTPVFDDSEEGSYVVEPGDDEAVEKIASEEGSYVVEPGDDEAVRVFDDSDEETETSSVDVAALREKYKAFYAMKR